MQPLDEPLTPGAGGLRVHHGLAAVAAAAALLQVQAGEPGQGGGSQTLGHRQAAWVHLV